MISQALQDTLLAIESRYLELAPTLDTVNNELALEGFPVQAGQVSALRASVGAQAAYIRATSIPNVAAAPNLVAALGTALGEFNGTKAFAVTIQPRFTAAVAVMPVSGSRDLADQQIDALRRLIQESIDEVETTATFPQGHGYNLGKIRYAVDDIASYPLLTSGIDSGGRSSAPAGGATKSLQRTVDLAMRQTLGRLPKYTDATAFTAALTASFAVVEQQGHTAVSWRPRSYVGQTELGGAVTGAQASVYARAREAVTAARPLLAGLTPLRPDADPEEMSAARGVVEAEFNALVDELGTEGGPRALRVERLFSVLLDETVIGVDNQPIPNGMVAYLGNVYGLEAGRVNTIAEEQDLSNFLLLRDYIETTRASWNTFFNTSFGRDLGTRLVLLSNALQVVAEAVDEVEAAMDSVFVGSSERSVARFSTGAGQTMLVSELLSWVSSFATQEAPDIVQQAGRRGMVAVASTADQLSTVTGQLIQALGSDPGLPDGLRHPRVRNPLDELRTYLGQVTQLAQQVQTA
jgi:hypothetical protein